MLKRILVLFAACALSAMAHAHKQAPPRLIDTPPGAQPIVLQRLSIHSDIGGSMAATTVKMVFYNPNARQLEGNLQFPLLDGQQIEAFALDINGAMRPAVPVDKAKGRAVFEEIVRRQVDPALLEVTQGNNFKLRVYPIPPRGTRTVELRYSEALGRKGLQWAYRLPLAYGQVGQFELELAVQGADAAPVVTGGPAGLHFERSKDGWRAQATQQDVNASSQIDVSLPASATPQVFVQTFKGDKWFVAEIPVDSAATPRKAPRTIGLLWDSSGSGAARDINAELTQLDRYLVELGSVEVRLLRLRDRAEAPKVFRVVDGNWPELRRALESTVYDGATAVNDWPVQPDVDLYLLFSDGLANYGGAHFPTLKAKQQLFAVNSAASADRSRLAALAARNGGALVDIDSSAPDTLRKALQFDQARIIGLIANGAADLESDGRDAGNGLLRIAGRLLGAEATLQLTLSNGGTQQTMSLPVGANAAASPQAALTWAGMRLRALEGDFEANRAQIGRIGRKFSLATRETSLIVLDSLEDYLRNEIEPPASMAAAYQKQKQARDSEQARTRRSHLDEVVGMFKRRSEWWNKAFPKALPKQDQAQGQLQPAARMVRPVEVNIQAMSPPPPAPPAAMAFAPPPPMMAPPAERMMAKMAVAGISRNEETDSRANASEARAPQIGIALKKWVPKAPYIERLRKAAPDKVYVIYLDERAGYANSSAFYLDAADILFDKGQRELGLRVLSNLAEMDLENRALLRILGYRLLQAHQAKLAVPVFEKVVLLAAEEPQSFRDLGLAHAAAGNEQQAIDRLYEVVERSWDGRFPEIENIVLAEINAIIARAARPLNVSRIDPRLRASQPLDLRVIMTWDGDNTDIDMWVTDPDGEKSFYGNALSRQGGRMSNDFTGGYGPEEFSLRFAKPGKYRVEANYYGNRQQVLAGATTLQLKLFTAFGTKAQREQVTTLRLKDNQETVFVGEFEVKP